MTNWSAISAAESTWHDDFPACAREDDHHWLRCVVSICPVPVWSSTQRASLHGGHMAGLFLLEKLALPYWGLYSLQYLGNNQYYNTFLVRISGV